MHRLTMLVDRKAQEEPKGKNIIVRVGDARLAAYLEVSQDEGFAKLGRWVREVLDAHVNQVRRRRRKRKAA